MPTVKALLLSSGLVPSKRDAKARRLERRRSPKGKKEAVNNGHPTAGKVRRKGKKREKRPKGHPLKKKRKATKRKVQRKKGNAAGSLND